MTGAGYPLHLRLQELFMSKKHKLLRDNGYYKTMGGNWRSNHGMWISNKDVKRLDYDALKLELRY